MKKVAALVVAGALATATALAQGPILTHPVVPAREALDRLNLQVGWRTLIPVIGERDGIATVQPLGDVVIAQTRRGGVAALDPMTGAVRWFANVGITYPVIHPVGYNDDFILVDNGTRVHALDRAKGTQLWEVNLPNTPSSPPTADDKAFYVHLGIGRVAAYAFPGVPDPNEPAKPGAGVSITTPVSSPIATAGQGAAPTGRSVHFSGAINTRTGTISGQVAAAGTSGGRTATNASEINKQTRGVVIMNAPRLLWFYQTNLRVQERPVVGEKTLLLVSNDRKAVFLDKEHGDAPSEFVADSPFTSPAGRYGETAYIGSRDGGVYALDLPTRTLRWSYTANSIVITAAVASDDDVFVAADSGGLIRLDRTSGYIMWQNTMAHRFLAANPKYVYAFDAQGRLLVLDRMRGYTLTALETRDFVMPIVNKVTDRLFLAANDGTLVCLHDKAYGQPVRMQNPPPAVAPSGAR